MLQVLVIRILHRGFVFKDHMPASGEFCPSVDNQTVRHPERIKNNNKKKTNKQQLSLDQNQDRQNAGLDLDPNHLTH